ncbi:MAG: hypothetical protein ACJARS_004823 [bacterium]
MLSVPFGTAWLQQESSMLSVLFLLVASVAHADCDADFHAKVAPADAPERPPIDRLLDFVYDGDDSGVLDASETAKRDGDMAMRCEALDAMITRIDADSNGVISDAERELLHGLVGRPLHPGRHRHHGHRRPKHDDAERPPLPPPAMRAYDSDRDHDLSDEERTRARADMQDRLRNGLPPFPHPDGGGHDHE